MLCALCEFGRTEIFGFVRNTEVCTRFMVCVNCESFSAYFWCIQAACVCCVAIRMRVQENLWLEWVKWITTARSVQSNVRCEARKTQLLHNFNSKFSCNHKQINHMRTSLHSVHCIRLCVCVCLCQWTHRKICARTSANLQRNKQTKICERPWNKWNLKLIPWMLMCVRTLARHIRFCKRICVRCYQLNSEKKKRKQKTTAMNKVRMELHLFHLALAWLHGNMWSTVRASVLPGDRVDHLEDPSVDERRQPTKW